MPPLELPPQLASRPVMARSVQPKSAFFYFGWHDFLLGDLKDRTVTQVPGLNHQFNVCLVSVVQTYPVFRRH